MPIGKSAAQACHAARLSLLHYLRQHPDQATDFRDRNSVGSVVVLAASLDDLESASRHASRLDLPWALFTDSGHVLPPHFDGNPVTTALAIGPAEKQRIKPFVRHLRCL